MKNSIKKQIRKLWECCFGDSPKFIDLYFNKRYTHERNLVITKDEKVVSALQLLPYPLKVYNQIVDTLYISGAATFPEYRNQGVMKQLILKSFHRMQNQSIPISTLIPAEHWLFDYYEKSGYATVFYAKQQTVKKEDLSNHQPTTAYRFSSQTKFNKELQSYMDNKLKGLPCSILHPQEDMEVVLADLALADGDIIVINKEKNIVGFAIIWQKENVIYINELIADSTDIEKDLFYFLLKSNQGYDTIQRITPSTQEKGEPLGMLRIINLESILNIFAQNNPNQSIDFNLIDSILETNSGYYKIDKGICIKKDLQEGVPYKNIVDVTRDLFLPLNPYMSLMLN